VDIAREGPKNGLSSALLKQHWDNNPQPRMFGRIDALTHDQVWNALDRLAARSGLSASSLA
jgi:hypothetical protein